MSMMSFFQEYKAQEYETNFSYMVPMYGLFAKRHTKKKTTNIYIVIKVTWILNFDVNKFKGNTNTKNLYNYT